MKNGYNTLLAVYKAIVWDSLSTRKEISESIGLSKVSVSHAVNLLIKSNIICADGTVSTGGRHSDFLSPDYSRKYLVINFCKKPFSYAITHLGDELSTDSTINSSVKFIPYFKDLDFGENINIASKIITKNLRNKPIAIAAAFPSSNNSPSDYLGDNILDILSKYNILPDILVSEEKAALACPKIDRLTAPLLYISIDEKVGAIYSSDEQTLVLDWKSVHSGGLSFEEILKCSSDDHTLANRISNIVLFAAEVMNVKNILIDSDIISDDTAEALVSNSDIITDITRSAPVLNGLLELLAERAIKMIE